MTIRAFSRRAGVVHRHRRPGDEAIDMAGIALGGGGNMPDRFRIGVRERIRTVVTA